MGYRVLQNSFNGGEVTPALYGRFDDQKYSSGAATVRNFICLPQGPVVNRPGFAYVNATKYPSKKSRLIPFVYSSEQTMALEFGEKYIRFHTEGQTLVNSDGTPYEIESPYYESDLFSIHYTQSADVLTLVHPAYAPRELRRYGPYDWRLEPIDFTLGITAPTGLKVTYTCGNNDATGKTNYKPYYRVTAIKDNDNGGYTESEPCAAVSIACNLYIDNSYNSLSWDAVDGAKRYRVYKTYSGVYGLLGETEETKYTDTNFDTDTSITPPRLDSAFAQVNGIESVTVANGGSGYPGVTGILVNPNGTGLPSREDFVSEEVASSVSKDSYQSLAYSSTDTRQDLAVACISAEVRDREDVTYPSYSRVVAALVSNMRVVDRRGNGTGASFTVTATYKTSVRSTFHTEGGGDNAYNYNTYYGIAEGTLTGIKILDGGSGYQEPVIAYFSRKGAGLRKARVYRTDFLMTTKDNAVTAYVTDSTGRGAELSATVVNGVVTEIRVINGGGNYTDPKVVITASTGSGAAATAKVATTGDYPSAVTYFQQRRAFAGAPMRPRMVWMTASGTENDMTYTIPAQDDNRIRFEIAAQEAARVLHLVPLSRLIALTGSSELRLESTDGGALTSETISVSPQASIGASEVQPVVVNSALIYAANRGGHIRELGYNYQASGFTTGDLSVRAAHLFENVTTVDMARMKTPDSIIWFVMSDGKLLGLTYLPEQSVAAWHQHDTDGRFESVCCVPEGQEDALYAIVRRSINGKEVRYVERMHERYYSALDKAFHVDCGATYVGEETTTISGLSWLEGKTVSILANGGVVPDCVVTDGKVTLPYPATYACVGLPITSELKTLPAGAQMQDGSMGRGHMKNVNKVFLRVYRSSGISIGPDEDHMTDMKMRSEEAFGEPPALVSEELPLAVSPKWGDSGQIVIRQTKPLPLTVVSWAADFAQ